MNKLLILFFVTCAVLFTSCNNSGSRVLFDGTKTADWQTTGNVTLKDSILTLDGPGASMILKNGAYQDFVLKLTMRTVDKGKGEIGFHTDNSGKGYRVALNNDVADNVWWRMTGSLISVRNLTKSFVTDNEWFDMTIRVEGQAVTVAVNGEPVVEYIEPANPLRKMPNERAVLSEGTFRITSQGKGTIDIKNIAVETINREDINIPAQLAMARDEQNDEILKLHQEDFPVLDFHVHLKGGLTSEVAARQSRRIGINYAIAPNCGVGFPITDDKGIYDFLTEMRPQPFILAMQAEGREWLDTFSEEARNEFDYVFTDALTFTDSNGRRTRLWINNETWIEDEQQYMDLIVDKICQVLQEPVDVYVNPCFLPEQMSDRYDEFWTEERMNKFVEALAASGKALEINELYNIPNKAIIMKAKQAGVKFTFGSNNVTPEVSRLEYSLKMKKECGLTQQDMYKPKIKL